VRAWADKHAEKGLVVIGIADPSTRAVEDRLFKIEFRGGGVGGFVFAFG
jgi:hypothetical protein